jgi:hypothetical protein
MKNESQLQWWVHNKFHSNSRWSGFWNSYIWNALVKWLPIYRHFETQTLKMRWVEWLPVDRGFGTHAFERRWSNGLPLTGTLNPILLRCGGRNRTGETAVIQVETTWSILILVQKDDTAATHSYISGIESGCWAAIFRKYRFAENISHRPMVKYSRIPFFARNCECLLISCLISFEVSLELRAFTFWCKFLQCSALQEFLICKEFQGCILTKPSACKTSAPPTSWIFYGLPASRIFVQYTAL